MTVQDGKILKANIISAVQDHKDKQDYLTTVTVRSVTLFFISFCMVPDCRSTNAGKILQPYTFIIVNFMMPI